MSHNLYFLPVQLSAALFTVKTSIICGPPFPSAWMKVYCTCSVSGCIARSEHRLEPLLELKHINVLLFPSQTYHREKWPRFKCTLQTPVCSGDCQDPRSPAHNLWCQPVCRCRSAAGGMMASTYCCHKCPIGSTFKDCNYDHVSVLTLAFSVKQRFAEILPVDLLP